MDAWISLVIPIAPGDQEWQRLVPLLIDRDEVAEIWLSSSRADADSELVAQAALRSGKIRVIQGSQGRGPQINRAIAAASGPWIWVLHADSQFPTEAWSLLERARQWPDALHYFDLSFQSPDPRMRLNAWGARWRSQIFAMPFGDQGFFFLKSGWQAIGGFPEHAAYGEDHLFVWRWRQAGRRLQRIPLALCTSARKYQKLGWWQTTWLHGRLTWKQAVPEIWALLAQRALVAKDRKRHASSPADAKAVYKEPI